FFRMSSAQQGARSTTPTGPPPASAYAHLRNNGSAATTPPVILPKPGNPEDFPLKFCTVCANNQNRYPLVLSTFLNSSDCHQIHGSPPRPFPSRFPCDLLRNRLRCPLTRPQ